MARAAQRRDAAAEAAAAAAAAAAVQEQSDRQTCVLKAAAAVAHAAAASEKAEAAALQAADVVRRSLQKQERAAAAAEAAHQRYRTCMERLQQEAAAMESNAIKFAHQEMIMLPNGIKAFDDAPLVGSIDRFFHKTVCGPRPWRIHFVPLGLQRPRHHRLGQGPDPGQGRHPGGASQADLEGGEAQQRADAQLLWDCRQRHGLANLRRHGLSTTTDFDGSLSSKFAAIDAKVTPGFSLAIGSASPP